MSSDTSATDKHVEEAILAVLASLTTVNSIRPNKLRKIICKQVKGTNWTQYQVVLDRMVSENAIQTKKEEGEKVLLATGDVNTEEPTKESRIQTKKTTLQIPQAVARHLTRKGHSKQKNIEKNTKTMMKIDRSQKDEVSLTIEAEYPTNESEDEDNKNDDNDVEEIVQKRINAAALLIKNMIKSYKKNPEHFEKKAGGTFAEQAEAKKRKEEILKKRHKKRSMDEQRNNKQKKKKERKFY
mmetsp:Transcript_14341/g.19974  ORF Transcript_14341/g.19974 Transcript_14341/m.19974 type:complete len:240 (-) Transcript_14341:23-742(-)